MDSSAQKEDDWVTVTRWVPKLAVSNNNCEIYSIDYIYIYTLLQFNIVMEESQLKMLKTQGNHVLMGDFPLQG